MKNFYIFIDTSAVKRFQEPDPFKPGYRSRPGKSGRKNAEILLSGTANRKNRSPALSRKDLRSDLETAA